MSKSKGRSGTEEVREGNVEIEIEVEVYDGEMVRIRPMYMGISIGDRPDGIALTISDGE